MKKGLDVSKETTYTTQWIETSTWLLNKANIKEGVLTMKGSVILFHHNNEMTILEDVDKSVFAAIQKQAGTEQCIVTLNNRKVDFGYVASPVYWREGVVYTD
ncbi:hypothetical protein J2S09_001487 [Bacillus fengqiuensis]|nr:hypothetical protein [Bacillus fengqiuensis]